MAPKQKEPKIFNPMMHPPMDLDYLPLADKDFKIHETLSKFDLFNIYYWWEDKFMEEMDDIGLWTPTCLSISSLKHRIVQN